VESRHYAFISVVQLHKWLNLRNGSALFDTIFLFQNYPISKDMPTSNLKVHHSYTIERDNYPLSITAWEADTLHIKAKYDISYLSDNAAMGMLRTLEALLTKAISHDDCTVADLRQIAMDAEKLYALQKQRDFNKTSGERLRALSRRRL